MSSTIIDFHVHCFTDELAARAVTSLSEASSLPPRSDGTVAGIKASMKKAGISRSVILNIATKPQQTRKITQWALSVQDEKVIAFGSIHPEYDEWKDELCRLRDSGVKGIKFHPEYQSFYVDDPKMFPIYEKAAELGLIMVFHAGMDYGFKGPYHCLPDRMKIIARAFPEAKIVAAHMGGFKYWEDVENYLAGEPLYFDTSFSLHEMSRECFLRIASKHGYDRLLFATDSPWGDQLEEVERIRSMGLSDAETEAVLGGNAAKLLGLTC